MSDDWDGILDKDEAVLWQGAPAPGVRFEWDNPFHPFFFLFFTGFSMFWMVMASAAGGIFWMFGLLFFGVGSYNLVGIHFWRAYQRKKTFYTLTSKRAIIATTTFGKRTLDSDPITGSTKLSFEERGALMDIHFASQTKRGKNSTYEVPIGFLRLNEGRNVYGLMRGLQDSDACA